MSPEWKGRVDSWLREHGKDRAWLARELDVEASTVKRLLEEQQSSALVPRIVEITGLPSPMVPVASSQHEDLIKKILTLNEQSLDAIEAVVDSLLASRGR